MSQIIHKKEHKLDDEPLSSLFVAQRNSDQTEGRGSMIDVAYFDNHTEAYNRIKGEAVQGCGDGDVVLRSWYRCHDCPEIIKTDKTIYVGDNYSKKNLLGKGSYSLFMKDGWHVDYSPIPQDPEYKEYLRLREKFAS